MELLPMREPSDPFGSPILCNSPSSPPTRPPPPSLSVSHSYPHYTTLSLPSNVSSLSLSPTTPVLTLSSSNTLRPPPLALSLSSLLQTSSSTLEPFTPPGTFLSNSLAGNNTPRYRSNTRSTSAFSISPRTAADSSIPPHPTYPPSQPFPHSHSSPRSHSSDPSSDACDPPFISTITLSDRKEYSENEDLPSTFSQVHLGNQNIKERFTYLTLKTILKNYGVACMLSAGAAIFSLSISYGASHIQYKVHNPTATNYYNTASFAQIVILFYVFGLLFFTVFQFYVFNGMKGLYDSKYITGVVVALALFVSAPLLLSQFGIPFQLYLIDVLLIVILFCGLTFMIGYFGKEQIVKERQIQMESPEPFMVRVSSTLSSASRSKSTLNLGFKLKTRRERVLAGIYYLVIEVLVSVTALVYGMFLITVYSSLSDAVKVAWRLILHPLYFEIFMMMPVHYLVARKMKNSQDINILYTLSVVHAQSHISTLGRMMFSTLDQLSITVISVMLLNVGKFFFRLSAPIRNSFVQRLISSDSKDTDIAAKTERQRYIVSAAIQTEMIVENSCAIFAGLTMYLFQDNKEIFMFPYPQSELTLSEVIFIILVQLGFAFVFDLATLYVAQKYLQLPILNTWRDMWHRKYRFFGFLLYGLLTMGVVGIFYMGFKAPRVPFCSSENVCSCVWLKWMHTTCDQFLANAALK